MIFWRTKIVPEETVPDIPSSFLIWRFTADKRLYAHVSVQNNEFHLVSYVTRPVVEILKQTEYKGWKEKKPYKISGLPGLPGIDTDMWYEGSVAKWNDSVIPCMNIRKACKYLPRIFVLLADYPSYWVFESGLTDADVHRAAVSAWFAPGDCPITMRPLDIHMACLTPCHHLFDRDALFTWLSSGKSQCPVCRYPLRPEKIHCSTPH